MDYTDLYLSRRPQQRTDGTSNDNTNVNHFSSSNGLLNSMAGVVPPPQTRHHMMTGAAPTATTLSGLGRHIDQLVGGTLAAQEQTDRVEELARRVDAFDEKLLNLTRLIKLSQALQEEKEADLRQQNAELRTRLQRQEQLAAQVQREAREAAETVSPALRAAIQSQIDAALTEQRQRLQDEFSQKQQTREEHWDALERRVVELGATQRSTLQGLTAELDNARQWTRRNMQHLKQHVDAVEADLEKMADRQNDLTSGLERVGCKAEVEYKKLRLILQQRSNEADALVAIVEKELRHVQDVAQQHEILRSTEVPAALEPRAFIKP